MPENLSDSIRSICLSKMHVLHLNLTRLHEVQLPRGDGRSNASVVFEYFHQSNVVGEHRVPYPGLLFDILRDPGVNPCTILSEQM